SASRDKQTALHRGIITVAAETGIATLQSADIIQDQNQFHLRGSTELPRDIHDLGRAPATMELEATLPDLEQVTGAMPQKISGAAQINGKANIKNAVLEGDFAVTAPALTVPDGRCENLSAC